MVTNQLSEEGLVVQGLGIENPADLSSSSDQEDVFLCGGHSCYL